ncbi:uncharacterized protein LOC136746672 [Amia ocellicauda]|uniref:uncharacterized protein LOC136746672 n=1 Tax=Amia ocellicauda TaxID=2972642 RepID=UPI003464DF63
MRVSLLTRPGLLLLFYSLNSTSGLSVTNWVAPCQWDWTGANNLTVNCTDRSLEAPVPASLPAQAYAIELSLNTITHIRRSHFPVQPLQAVRLNLSNNRIGEIQDWAFGCFVKLEVLDLSSNRLSTLGRDTWWRLGNLKELRLGHNVIKTVHSSSFASLVRAETLWLQNNSLVNIPQAVKRMSSLRVLSLAQNRIFSVDSGSLQGCSDLAILQLEHNLISRVSKDTFEGLDKLKVLNLSFNMLQTTQPAAFEKLWDQDADVMIDGNPWRCDCKLKELRELAPTLLSDQVQCQGGPLHGFQLSALRPEQLQCSRPLVVLNAITIQLPADRSSKLPCTANGLKGQVLYWETPFGRLRNNYLYGTLDPVTVLRDGSLQITKSALYHTGLYYCFLSDRERRAIIPYRTDVRERSNREARLRNKRETSTDPETVSEELFISIVTISVLVAALVGFVLGAFSRSYFNKYWRQIKQRQVVRDDPTMNLEPLTRQHKNMDLSEERIGTANKTRIYETLSQAKRAEQGISPSEGTRAGHVSVEGELPGVSGEGCVAPWRPYATLNSDAQTAKWVTFDSSTGNTVPAWEFSTESGTTEYPQLVFPHSPDIAEETPCEERKMFPSQDCYRRTDSDASTPTSFPKTSVKSDDFGNPAEMGEHSKEDDYIVYPVKDTYRPGIDPWSSGDSFDHKSIVPEQSQYTPSAAQILETPGETKQTQVDHFGLERRPSAEEMLIPQGVSEEEEASMGFCIDLTQLAMDEDASDCRVTLGDSTSPEHTSVKGSDTEEGWEGNKETHAAKVKESDSNVDSNGETEVGEKPAEQEQSMTQDNQDSLTAADSRARAHSARRRVIRLYNYDDEGKLYDHIKESEEYACTPRQKQRSQSLTRLSAIMNAGMARDFSAQ